MQLKPWTASAFVLLCCTAFAEPQVVIVHANVFTADTVHPRAEAIAIEGGRFSAVGDEAEIRTMAGPGTRVIDAGGRLVTPGLIEAHVHIGSALPSAPVPMPAMPFPGPSGEQALAAVEAAAKGPGDWVTAFIGPSVARDPRNWRTALDAVTRDRPVVLFGFWGHTTILNSAALKRLGIAEDVQDPVGGWWGRDAEGRLDGHAYETAEGIGWQRVVAQDASMLALQFREAAQRYARWGVTSIHLMNSGKSLPLTIDTLTLAKTPQKWTIYSWARLEPRIADAWSAMDAAPKSLPNRVRIDGPKWILDGTGIEQNALQREAYLGRPGWHGRSNYTDEQLRQILGTALNRREQIALHVVGDAETDRLFKTMQSLATPETWKSKRVRVEHGDGIRNADSASEAARFGVVVTQNPTHLLPAPSTGGPPALFDRPSLLSSLLTAGVPLALGSDGGPAEANPFLNIMLATTYGALPAEALTREQALVAYTAGGAYAERQEETKGRVKVGMAADLTVMSQDVLTVPSRMLPTTKSLLTMVDGEIVFEDPDLTAGAQPR
jgi:predicted amidohydrolase YtcJ